MPKYKIVQFEPPLDNIIIAISDIDISESNENEKESIIDGIRDHLPYDIDGDIVPVWEISETKHFNTFPEFKSKMRRSISSIGKSYTALEISW